jgi:hypothetical protein
MATITLYVKDGVLKKVLKLLGKFDDSEVRVVSEDAEFLAQKKYLNEQVAKFDRGEMKTYSIEEVNSMMDKVISEYEN